MTIQPVSKAVEHLINSTPVLGEGKKKKRGGGKAVNAYLIKNSKGEREREREGGGGGGGGGTLTSSQKD